MTKIFSLSDSQNDTFVGAAETGPTQIYGLGGHDSLYGGLGNDTIRGGSGNDTLWGANGTDLVYGDAGNDRLIATSSAGGGSSTLVGGMGDDTYVVGAGQAAMIVEGAFSGNDSLRLGTYSHGQNTTMAAHVETLFVDTVIATPNPGALFASVVNGNTADNTMHADAASIVTLHGRGGNDTLHGGSGVDDLFGGAGHDKLAGNAGATGCAATRTG